MGDDLRAVKFPGLGVGIFGRGLSDFNVVGIGVYVWNVVVRENVVLRSGNGWEVGVYVNLEYLFVSNEGALLGSVCVFFQYGIYSGLCCVCAGGLRCKESSSLLTYILPRCERYVTVRYGTVPVVVG